MTDEEKDIERKKLLDAYINQPLKITSKEEKIKIKEKIDKDILNMIEQGELTEADRQKFIEVSDCWISKSDKKN